MVCQCFKMIFYLLQSKQSTSQCNGQRLNLSGHWIEISISKSIFNQPVSGNEQKIFSLTSNVLTILWFYICKINLLSLVLSLCLCLSLSLCLSVSLSLSLSLKLETNDYESKYSVNVQDTILHAYRIMK